MFGTYTNEGKVLGIFIGLISAATQSELKKGNFPLYIRNFIAMYKIEVTPKKKKKKNLVSYRVLIKSY